MSKILVIDREGNLNELQAEKGLTFMEIIRDAGLDIEAACGGCCACATCHIYVDDKWSDKIPKREESALDYRKSRSDLKWWDDTTKYDPKYFKSH